MEDTTASFVSLLLCLLPFCLGLLGLAGFGALLIALVRRAQRPRGEADRKTAEQKNRVEVAALMAEVQPWRPEALADLRQIRQFRYGIFMRQIRARGLIAAARGDKQRTWAAFALRGQRVRRGVWAFHGGALARTSERALAFRAAETGEVAVRLDGRPLGSIQPDGELRDAAGQPVGQALFAAKDRPAGAVTLRGREAARLGDIYSRDFSPAVTVTVPFPTPEEQDWLLALALWRVVNRAAAQVRYSQAEYG
ncbi:MAG: hypothetical protein HF973_17150 [Chloroflexi bacterium]|nr:hypothetical protein [Chloroflexota bacterium]